MNKTIYLLAFAVFLIGLVGAEVNPCGDDASFLGVFKANDNVSLKQVCDNCTYVNVSSVKYPDSNFTYLNESMTKNGVDYNYTFSNTSNSGCYSYTVFGDKNGITAVETINFEINPTGLAQNESRTTAVSRGVYFLFAIAMIFFIAFLFVNSKAPIKWSLFLIAFMFFLSSLNILFVGLQDEIVNPKIEGFFSFIVASSTYLFWGSFGLLGFIWIVTTFQTLMFKHANNKALKYS